jgi:hypothetical protein
VIEVIVVGTGVGPGALAASTPPVGDAAAVGRAVEPEVAKRGRTRPPGRVCDDGGGAGALGCEVPGGGLEVGRGVGRGVLDAVGRGVGRGVLDAVGDGVGSAVDVGVGSPGPLESTSRIDELAGGADAVDGRTTVARPNPARPLRAAAPATRPKRRR